MPGPARPARAWTTPDDVASRLRRSWTDGSLLSSYGRGEPWQPRSVALHGPQPTEVAERLDDVRDWVARLERGCRRGGRSAYRLEYRAVGGRAIGANRLPARAWLDAYDCVWTLLGVGDEAERYLSLLDAARVREPRVADWMLERPMRALELSAEWARLLPAARWLADRAGTGAYLRQIDVAGVDTKYVEAHRGVLADLLDRLLPAERVDRSRPRTDLAARYGFRGPTPSVRFRFLGDERWPPGLSELTGRIDELAAHAPVVSRVYVVENEMTYLAFPPVDDAVVVLGGGYGVSRLAQLPWLSDMELHYWGDLDTHGFAILDQLRHAWPHTRSLLMDRRTLLAHETQWVREPKPVNALLDRLAADETALYRDLVEGTLGPTVRLEQERVGFGWVEDAVTRTWRA
ncbi:MAG TPA: Wadjet anti-phage system protein JetD domain-containing protein [Jiangellales bacterium]|nr:Wadjet anti-phage system protein JetD domain-containing protein [Jiangellales bacterium]